jgi:hypothetical protein
MPDPIPTYGSGGRPDPATPPRPARATPPPRPAPATPPPRPDPAAAPIRTPGSGLGGIVAVVACILVLALIAWALVRRGSGPESPGAQGTTLGAAVQPIQITDPPLQSPPVLKPRSFTVSGVGDVPLGHHLWIFVYGPGAQQYFPQDKVGSSNPNPWAIPVTAGTDYDLNENGKVFSICAVLVDDVMDARIAANGNNAYSIDEWRAWFRPSLRSWTEVQRSDSGQALNPPSSAPGQACGS